MKKVIKSILKNMIFYAILFTAIFIFSKRIINDYNMEFRNWFYVFAIGVMFLFLVIGILQIICKMKDKLIKTFISLTLLVFIGISLSISYFFYTVIIPYQEQTIEINGEKMVGHTYYFMTTKIEYYKYINSIIRGKDIVLYEER